MRTNAKHIAVTLVGIVIMTACTLQGTTEHDHGTSGEPNAIEDFFGRATSSRLRIGGTEGQSDSWTISILEVVPTRYDASSGHFDDRSTSAAAMICYGDKTIHLLGERKDGRLCLVDSELLLGPVESPEALSFGGFEERMGTLNRRGALECRRVGVALPEVGDVLLVLSPRCAVVSAIESATHPCSVMIEPMPVIRRVLHQVGPANHWVLLAMIDAPSGSHPVLGAGVAVARPHVRRFEGAAPARCPWPTKRGFAIHIAEALEACGTTLEQAPEDEMADALNRASGLRLDGSEWRQMMVDCFGSIDRADASLCFLPEVEFTPFLVVSTKPGTLIFGTWWLPSDWASACEAHRYRCVALSWPPEDDSRPVSLNIWRYPSDESAPNHFEGEFVPVSELQGPPRSRGEPFH